MELENISMKDWNNEQIKLLGNSFLSECNFSQMQLDGIDFYRAEIYSCNFQEARLKNVEFPKCEISYSDFSNSQLSRVSFHNAEGTEAVFNGAEMRFVSFAGAFLERADFRNCTMEKICFDDADLIEILISEEDLPFYSNLSAHSVSVNIGTREEPKIQVLK